VIRQRGGEQAGAILHQELDHGQIVAAGGTMQWRPAIRILGIHIAAKLNEKSKEESD